MEFVTDLHLHSRYSRAVSSQMVLPTMRTFALSKGIHILTASDWTHTLWFKEMSASLEEIYDGIYVLKGSQPQGLENRNVLFLLSTEIASIYTHKGKLRRIHNLVFVPNLETAEKVNKELLRRGCNLSSDGRPIIGISSKDLLSLLLEIDERNILIPCHVWTPHFGVYGSASGYDSIDEAFEDLAPYIYGIETGISSDPSMNWQIEELEKRSILSFSDAHSPAKMGREATVFVTKDTMESEKSSFDISYNDFRLAIMRKSPKLRIGYTIEFYPEEGKYHYSGHRNCGIVYGPDEIKSKGQICPVCKKKLTEGVLVRVQALSSPTPTPVNEKKNTYGLKWYTDATQKHPPFIKLVPLLEVVAESMDSTVSSQKVKTQFEFLCETFGSEITVLLKTPYEQLQQVGGLKLAEGIQKVREGSISIAPGYDGEYGKVAIWEKEEEKKEVKAQIKSLFDI